MFSRLLMRDGDNLASPKFSHHIQLSSTGMTPHELQGAEIDFAVLDTRNWDRRTPVGGGSSVATPPSRGARIDWKKRATRATTAMGRKVGNKIKGAGGRGVVASMVVVGSDVDEENGAGAGDFRASAGVVGVEDQEEEVVVLAAPVDHANERIETRSSFSSSSSSSSSCPSTFGPPMAPLISPPSSSAGKLPAGVVRRPLRFGGTLEVPSSSVIRDARARHQRRSPRGELEAQDPAPSQRGRTNVRKASSGSTYREGGEEWAAKMREEEEEEDEEEEEVMVAEEDMTPVGKRNRAARTPPTRSRTRSTSRAREVQLHN
jgi:hypothetical protein